MKIIINADDFGIDFDRDLGIIFCALLRSIDSISVMVTYKESYPRLKKLIKLLKIYRKDIKIGLHINLTDRYLITCRLEDFCKDFSPTEHPKVVFWKSALTNECSMDVIKREIVEQFDTFVRLFEMKPDHIDGHNHCHIAHKEIFDFIESEAKRFSTNYIRVPNEDFDEECIKRVTKIYKHLSQEKLLQEYYKYEHTQQITSNFVYKLAQNMRNSPISDIYLYKTSCSLYNITQKDKILFSGTTYGHVRKLWYLVDTLKKANNHGGPIEIMVHPGLILPIKHNTKFSNIDRAIELINLLLFRLCRIFYRW